MISFLKILIAIFVVLYAAETRAEAHFCHGLVEREAYKGNTSLRYLEPGKDGWLFRTRTDFKEDFSISDENIRLLKRFSDALKKQAVSVYLVIPPTRGLRHPDQVLPDSEFDHNKASDSYAAFLEALSQAGVKVVDFSDMPQKIEGFFYKRDHHFAVPGAKAIAWKIAQKVQSDQQNLPKASYNIEMAELAEFEGRFEKFAEKICAREIENESVNVTQAYMVAGDTENSLFMDVPEATTVLIGTSNSAEGDDIHANFPGYLRYYLKTEIDNASVIGGGVRTPMLGYLLSDDYKTKKHKVLIWEMPAYYDFDDEEYGQILKELIPAVYGECSKESLKQEAGEIKAGHTSLADHINITKPTYIRLEFDRALKQDIGLLIKSRNKRERLRMESLEPHVSRRTVYYDLSAFEGEAIEAIDVLTNADFPFTAARMDICPYSISSKE